MTFKVNIQGSKSEDKEPDMNSEMDETQADEPSELPAMAAGQPDADLEAAKAEAADWQDRFLRKAAEFENYKKRMERERSDALNLAKSSVLVEFLPVADACERALESMDKDDRNQGDLQQYREGVELLYKQLLDTFSRSGVVPIESQGKLFDPHLHEALSRQEDARYERDTVVHELRRGYLFKDKLLRPAQVIVAVASDASKDKES
jgi:molecular chaperone GrpE